MAIKAIETHYMGFKFRSRLEARWAVFFQSLGIKWDYEPEGFNLDGVLYLPDFKLEIADNTGKALTSWIEIKPRYDIPGDEIEKCYRFARAGNLITVMCGDPYDFFNTRNEEAKAISWSKKGERTELETPYTLMAVGAISVNDVIEVERIHKEKGYTKEAQAESFIYVMVAMVKAHDASEKARAARFEHGEKG